MRTTLGVLLLAILGLVATLVAPVGAEETDDRAVEIPAKRGGLLRSAGDPSALPPGTELNVEVHGSDLAAVAAAIGGVGGAPYGEVPGHFVEASVPADALAALEEHPAVTRIARPTVVAPPLQSGSTLATVMENTIHFDAWHDDGHKGAGQKIGILDIFGQPELDAAVADGRLPPPAGTFCLRFGVSCALAQTPSAPHGVGVAEIVHRAAPEAELYLASVITLSDLAAAIQWFADRGVTVINRSETSQFDGAGDGTGPLATLVDLAVANDIVWVAAAGNAAGRAPNRGQNWVGDFNDPDTDGFHNWASGDELMEFRCGFLLGMRWDDWDPGLIATDYDLWIFDDPSDIDPEATGDDFQDTADDPPMEHVDTICSDDDDMDYFAIVKHDDLQSDGVDEIQIMGNFTDMEEWVNPHSATGPGADSANPGSITVGASASPTQRQRAGYSSVGPTFDGRDGVDLLAPSCLPLTHLFGSCFTGTSAAAPVVAGAMAVLRGAGVIEQADDAGSIVPAITDDLETAGADPETGLGSFDLPPPAAFGVLPASETCFDLVPTILGTSGDDILNGTEGADVILAGDGDDVIDGRGGRDTICAGNGRDIVDGGGGADLIDGGEGRDRIRGGTGGDSVFGGAGGDRIVGNVGADQVRGEGGNDRVFGGAGDDLVRGGAGRDRLAGSPGIDTVHGGVSTDTCSGAGLGEADDAGDVVSRCELR